MPVVLEVIRKMYTIRVLAISRHIVCVMQAWCHAAKYSQYGDVMDSFMEPRKCHFYISVALIVLEW